MIRTFEFDQCISRVQRVALQHKMLMAQGKDFGLEGSLLHSELAKQEKRRRKTVNMMNAKAYVTTARKVNAFNRNGVFDRDNVHRQKTSVSSCAKNEGVDEITHLVIWRRISQIDG